MAITNSASAAIFQPGVNETEYNKDLEISYTKNDVSPTGIGFTGGTSSTPVEFDFNGNVNITLKQDSMTVFGLTIAEKEVLIWNFIKICS